VTNVAVQYTNLNLVRNYLVLSLPSSWVPVVHVIGSQWL